MLRIVRIISIFFSLLLPGVYLAITNFHQEMIPTDLLFAIGAARERVPFPTLVEILIMEFAFELIREAGIRIPGPIGPTLGIIGALILGQAAVAANIVSPILIIIVAVTGIGNFASPNFSQGFAFRIMRFGFIFMGSLSGFLGITTGLFILGLVLCHSKSFGVPFVSPFAPKTRGSFAADVLKLPLWKMESRPDYLNPKDRYRQPKISRGWTQRGEGEDDDDGE
jgi:spore germination protein KA